MDKLLLAIGYTGIFLVCCSCGSAHAPDIIHSIHLLALLSTSAVGALGHDPVEDVISARTLEALGYSGSTFADLYSEYSMQFFTALIALAHLYALYRHLKNRWRHGPPSAPGSVEDGAPQDPPADEDDDDLTPDEANEAQEEEFGPSADQDPDHSE